MEIRRESNTDNLGEELYASRDRADGSKKPAFDRVMTVHPGDRVLHWWQRSIIGVSVVAEHPSESDVAATAVLRDFIRFDVPVTRDDLRRQTEAVATAYADTRGDSRWSQFALQIDHAESESPVVHGAPTTYFVAVPPALVDSIEGLPSRLNLASDLVAAVPEESSRAVPRPAFEADPERRRAVEKYAEEVAVAELKDEGYTDIRLVGKPYDIQAFRNGVELRVEVKGSSRPIDAVVLTRNEVGHASEHDTSLIVVDRIDVHLTDSGYHCTGGHLRRWDSWVPENSDLEPLQYSYLLPKE
ncbi:MAG: DUF3883 domain-containing protein [Gordonia sp. (in: high G+C Gram-positive bacteria)]|uniref:protein NO VEIN domain-containing protein n=1 Tax=Gordonia sp. (in: high G+C Gram-positive bacteria) TaxID=84139 RepID=UPI003C7968D6